MSKIGSKIQSANPPLWMDWVIATICLLAGEMSIQLSTHSNLWSYWVEQNPDQIQLAIITDIQGSVRYRKKKMSAWQDVTTDTYKSILLSAGDELTAGERGSASVKILDSSHTIRLNHQSRMTLQTDPQWLSASNPSKRIHLLNLKDLLTGQFPDPSPFVKMSINRMTSQDTAQVVPSFISSKTQPNIPRILRPLSGTHFISSANEQEAIELQWDKLPFGLKPEVEFHRLDDPHFNSDLETTSSGGVIHLPDGNYSWKVRSIQSEELAPGQAESHPSDWTSLQVFSIQENVRETQPVAILESTQKSELNEKKDLAKKAEAERPLASRTLREKNITKLIKKSILKKRKTKMILNNQVINREKDKEDIHRKKIKYKQIVESAAERINEFNKKNLKN